MNEHLISAQTLHEWRLRNESASLPTGAPVPDSRPETLKLEPIAASLSARTRRLEDTLSAHAGNLAIEIAGAFIREYALDSGLAQATALQELKRLSQTESILLRVSVQDLPQVEAALREAYPSVSVEADPSLSAGDCIIESPETTVDARLSRRLEQVRRELRTFQNNEPW